MLCVFYQVVLFGQVTDEHKIYPSPVSHLQDNHLALFEFVGRMPGKAVYEVCYSPVSPPNTVKDSWNWDLYVM